MSEEKATVSSSKQNSGTGNVNASTTGKSNKKIIIVLSSVILVLVVAVGALAISLFSKDDKEEITDGRATFVSDENLEEVKENLSKPIEDAYYTTSMTIDWEFPDGESMSTSAIVENVTENTRTVYFDVHLESGELVYSSPYLPVGAVMDQIILDVDLDKGDYPAVVTYHLVDDDHNELSTVAVAITIHVLN